MSGKESGWEGVDFKGWLIYPNFGFRERGGDAAKTPRFCPEETRNLTQRGMGDWLLGIGGGYEVGKDEFIYVLFRLEKN